MQISNTLEKQQKFTQRILRFFDTSIKMLWKNIFLGHISTFANFEA
jgi:hypothetical protein